MTDERFLNRVRDDASALRYEGDDWVTARIAARVRERVAEPPTVAQFLARWFRPVAASFSAIALAAALSLVWTEARSETASLDSLSASSSVEVAVGGDVFSVGD